MIEQDLAVVLFSGGQDSTTCLAWALQRFAHVETIGFVYGQRHEVELKARERILPIISHSIKQPTGTLGEDHLIDLSVFGEISDTALTRDRAIELLSNGLPSTFVPGRNIVFLTFAAAVAYRRGGTHLVAGMCETDYSGYPDCRDQTIKATEKALALGLDYDLRVHTPLMWIDKAATWSLAHDIGGAALIDLIVEETHTCYMGHRDQRHAWGYGCGTCPACELRARGFEKFQNRS